MSLNLGDEILQDFLVEAGELLEKLSEQLVELEGRPDDKDLLNAVFRSFHTIKGGAGFLGLENLVIVCHKSEDIFNLLRTDQRSIDADMMDVILTVIDDLNVKFDEIRSGEMPSPSDSALIEKLSFYADPSTVGLSLRGNEPADGVNDEAKEEAPLVESTSSGDDISEAEFEDLLDQMHGKGKFSHDGATTKKSSEAQSDEITEEEFEALLDSMHGKGKGPSDASPAPSRGTDSEVRSLDEEFEAALDAIHGKGNAPGAKAPTSSDSSSAQPAAKIKEPTRDVKSAASSQGSAPPQSPAAPQADTTVRVDTKRLDDIMNLVGELVLVRNRLATLRSEMTGEGCIQAIENLDLVTSDLQAAVMKTRMQPVKKVFGRFPRVVRDLARSLNKEVKLELRGEETDLDKNLVEALSDPLVHLVRNAVDHGVETPDEREAAGKSRIGTVILSAAQEGDHILITIEDDGKGMDPEVLKAKAIEKGVIDEDAASRMSASDCYNLIFAPGFSTKTEISDVSGRGVGMDVVKTKIMQLNGSVVIDSEKGRGSIINIKLPLTLAILPTLMVTVGGQIFALPLGAINEILDLDLKNTNHVDGKLVIMVRDKALPLHYLHSWLIPDSAPPEEEIDGPVVIANVGNQRVGFVVDTLLGQEEVVIKPLSTSLHGIRGFAGATITGDGCIALIIDMQGLLQANT